MKIINFVKKVMTLDNNKLDAQSYIEPEMIEAAFGFWFNDQNHVRSPFPAYIREQLSSESIDRFLTWSSQLSEKAKEEINDEILAEKFEEILFESALDMVLTEDEKLTIKYPFMPRIGDSITQHEGSLKSTVIERWYEKERDHAFLKVRSKQDASGEIWETKFELPE